MKETYNTPKMEIVKFECEDIITTSGENETTQQVFGSPSAVGNWED